MNDKNKAVERLEKALSGIPHLKTLYWDSSEFKKWKRGTQVAIKHVFGDDSTHLSEFLGVHYASAVLADFLSMGDKQKRDYLDGLDAVEALLNSMMDEIKEYWEDEEAVEEEIDIADFLESISKEKFPLHLSEPKEHVRLATELINENFLEGSPLIDGQGIPLRVAITGMTIKGREYIKQAKQEAKKSNPVNDSIANKKVFIVHGHDNEVKQAVARFVEKLKLEPIILHEKANRGESILGKFENNADVAFAIVLLTPDDKGVAKKDLDNEKDRARQNVIFEMGYFIGRLGKHKVCAITKGEVEIPSDYSGILYINYAENWELSLFRELRAAGFEIDANDMT
jgi:predicted nucleotide-binding protein